MRGFTFISIFLQICTVSLAQNLIENPSFDSLYLATKNTLLLPGEYPAWTGIGFAGGSVDMYHDSILSRTPGTLNWFGLEDSQLPRSGPGMIGAFFYGNLRPNQVPGTVENNSVNETFQSQLISPLEVGATYSFTMHVNIWAKSLYTVSPLGVGFRTDSVSDPYNPVDTFPYTLQFSSDRYPEDSVGWSSTQVVLRQTRRMTGLLLGIES